MKEPGAVLLVACYELGHQPLTVAWPAAFLVVVVYCAVVFIVLFEPLDAERVARAKLVAISVPMHTALRLGVVVAERVRAINPSCHIVFYGLYATLNAEHLLSGVGDSVMSGEIESALVRLVQRLEAGAGGRTRDAPVAPTLEKRPFPVPSRVKLPILKRYAQLERDGGLELVGHVEGSRGCKHLCRHCPIPPVYGGRLFVVPRHVVLADIRPQVEAGGAPHTLRGPELLQRPGPAPGPPPPPPPQAPPAAVDFSPQG